MSARRKDDAQGMSALVRRKAPLRTVPSEAVQLTAKVTGRITQAEALAFKQAILVGGTKIEPTLRAMIRLYAEDEAFRAQVDEKRQGQV